MPFSVAATSISPSEVTATVQRIVTPAPPLRHALPLKLDQNGRPVKIDSCYAYGSRREVVRVRWPEHYDGPR